MTDLSPERQSIIATMQAMGWTATRTRAGKSVMWKFQRPDTGGLWDSISVNQKALTVGWLIFRVGTLYEDGLRDAMRSAADVWLRNNYPRQFGAMEAPHA